MNTKLKSLIIGGALLAGISGTAAARDNVSFSLSFGVPAYTYAPRAPVYYAPPAYYEEPPVVYYNPAPVYYSAPVYYAQPAFGFTIRDGHRHGYRHGHRRHHR